MWTPCRIRIIEHPRLEVGRIYPCEKDENGHFYVDTKNGAETVYAWEAEEMPDGTVE